MLSESDHSLAQPDSLSDYLSLKYLVEVYLEERGFTVTIPELPGCMSQGQTFEEAMFNIDKAKCLWIETVYADDKRLIPLPSKQSFNQSGTNAATQTQLHGDD